MLATTTRTASFSRDDVMAARRSDILLDFLNNPAAPHPAWTLALRPTLGRRGKNGGQALLRTDNSKKPLPRSKVSLSILF